VRLLAFTWDQAVTVSGDEVIRALGANVDDISDVSPTA